MPKTVTLRLDERTYRLFHAFAVADNRPLSNMIETAAKKHLEECLFVDASEERAIYGNPRLVAKLKSGSRAAREKRGRLIG